MQLIKTKKAIIESKPVIYEVNLTIDNDVIDEFDEWLQKHVDEMLAIPGFISASTAVIENNDENTKQRSVQFRLTNQAALDTYYEKDAERLRASALEKFSDKITVQRRVLTPSQAALAEEAACANCGTQLEGRFCRSCGQREEPRVPTFMAMLKEATNALFGLESKLWQSVYTLVTRPGKLTTAYLSGQRQKFTTPFRIFLLFSIFTLAYVSFISTQSLGNIPLTSFSSFEETVNEEVSKAEDADNLVIAGGLLPAYMEDALKNSIKNSFVELSKDLKAGNVDKVVSNFIQPLPKVLLLFLPFIALAFKIIYLGRGKYYAEHLIYLLHNHAFLFALLIITMLTVQLAGFYPSIEYVIAMAINIVFIYYIAAYFIKKIKNCYPAKKAKALINTLLFIGIIYGIFQFTKSSNIGSSIIFLWVFYAPYYMYRSMREVYKSSRFVTILNYGLIGMVYLILFMLMMVLYLVFSGLTYA